MDEGTPLEKEICVGRPPVPATMRAEEVMIEGAFQNAVRLTVTVPSAPEVIVARAVHRPSYPVPASCRHRPTDGSTDNPHRPQMDQSILFDRNTLTDAVIKQLFMSDLELEVLEGTCGKPLEVYRKWLVAILVAVRNRGFS